MLPFNYLKENVNSILELLETTNNIKINDLVLEKAPDLPSQCSQEKLLNALKNSDETFVCWILNNGFNLEKDFGRRCLEEANKTFNLKIIKTICQYLHVDYSDHLNLDGKNNEELSALLTSFAFNSPLQDVYEMIDIHPLLSTFLPNALKLASCLVRFPQLSMFGEIIYPKSLSLEEFNHKNDSYAKDNHLYLYEMEIQIIVLFIN